MEITDDMLKGLAALAQLDLDPAESARMKRDLDAILGYAAKLDELDTEDVPPTAHVLEVDTPVREDEVKRVLPVAEAVRGAPEHDERSMIVPKVIE